MHIHATRPPLQGPPTCQSTRETQWPSLCVLNDLIQVLSRILVLFLNVSVEIKSKTRVDPDTLRDTKHPWGVEQQQYLKHHHVPSITTIYYKSQQQLAA